METMKETSVRKRKVWPWILACVLVLAAAGVTAFLLWPRPLVTAPAYVAADLEKAPIYDDAGAQTGELVRGTTVTYVVEEEHEEHPGQIRLVMGGEENGEVFEKKATFAWIDAQRLTDDLSKVV